MAAGRKQTPTKIKRLNGNPGKRALNKSEPTAGKFDVRCPSYLTDRSKRAWRGLVDVLGKNGMDLLDRGDAMALEMLCDAYGEYLEARTFIKRKKKSTYDTMTESGSTIHRPYPQVAIAQDAWKRVKSMLAEFGLTPSSRVKFGGNDEDEEDPLQELLNRRTRN